jgi:cytochrome c peroxidase
VICGAALLVAAQASCAAIGDAACDRARCELTDEEWVRLERLAGLPDPPPDPSNKYSTDPAAQALGQKLYFDPAFSGNATQLDMLRRATPYARAPKGQPIQISCATCHNPARAGGDYTSTPGHVSVGAGWYDVNGMSTVNAAYFDLLYWNGRNDSLWSQIIAVTESFVSMGGNRLKVAYRLRDAYRAEYEAVFVEYPLPLAQTSMEVMAGLETNGQCVRAAAECPAGCVEDSDSTCWPRFPLQGRPGATEGCQRGDAREPFGDAFDCMAADDQKAITRVYVNFAKAIAAYESQLVSRRSAFDRFIAEGPGSQAISASARRGARLFVGKASCVDCHDTPLLSDNQFHNIGVPQLGAGVPTEADCPEGGACDCVAGKNCLPWGGWDGLGKLAANKFRRDSAWSDAPEDASRSKYYALERPDTLKGAWRTPSLRDVAITAPYMHNGIYRTLEEVIWHYDQGGGAQSSAPLQKSKRLRPLRLTGEEVSDLIAFLETLTGEPLPASLTTAPVLPP